MSFLYYFRELIVALVWVLANVVYLDLKRKGIRGFTRFAAFWVGQPTTLITFFAVREGRQPTFHTPDGDDEGDEILAEIRRDRALAEGDEGADGVAAAETPTAPARPPEEGR